MSFQENILNILLISIPEEFFISMLILILLGRYDFLSREKLTENFTKIMYIVAVPMSVLASCIRLKIKNDNLLLILCIISFSIFISILYRITTYKQYFKILLITFVAYVIFMTTELFTIFIVLYVLKLSPTCFNQSAILNFYIVIPERLIQYGFLTIVFIKKNAISQVNISKLINENKSLKMLTIICTLVDIIILTFMLTYCVYGKMLSALKIEYQIFIIVVVLSFAIFNIFLIWVIPICIYSFEKHRFKYKNTEEESYDEE